MLEHVPVWKPSPDDLPVSLSRHRWLKRQKLDLRKLLKAEGLTIERKVRALLPQAFFAYSVSVVPYHAHLVWSVAIEWFVLEYSVCRLAQAREELQTLLPRLPSHEQMGGLTVTWRSDCQTVDAELVDPEERLLLWSPAQPPRWLADLGMDCAPGLTPVLDNKLTCRVSATLPYLEPEAFARRLSDAYEPLARSVQAPVPAVPAG